jgi:hypothetical protein
MKITYYLAICGLIFISVSTLGQNYHNITGLYFNKSKDCLIRQEGIYLISLNEFGKAYVIILTSGDVDIITETDYTFKNDTIKITDHGNFVFYDSKIISTINKRNKLRKANNSEMNNLHKKYERKLNKYNLTFNNDLIKKL